MPIPDPLKGLKLDPGLNPVNSRIRIRDTATEAHYVVGKAHNGATEAQHGAIKAQKPCRLTMEPWRPLGRSWRLGSH
jgi:hypothetical protein